MNFAPNEILLFIWYSSLKIFCTAVKKKSIIKLAIPKSSECYFFFFFCLPCRGLFERFYFIVFSTIVVSS